MRKFKRTIKQPDIFFHKKWLGLNKKDLILVLLSFVISLAIREVVFETAELDFIQIALVIYLVKTYFFNNKFFRTSLSGVLAALVVWTFIKYFFCKIFLIKNSQ